MKLVPFSTPLSPRNSKPAVVRPLTLPSAKVALAVSVSALLGIAFIPEKSTACACGCGVFEVGDFSMFPEGGQGSGFGYLNFDFQDQNHNWSSNSRAPARANSDKGLQTYFFTPGIEYMFDRRFGLQVELPYDDRSFTTLGGRTGNQVITRNWSQFGDLRISGIYTGLLRDQSLGFTVGLKLPTGDFRHSEPGIDVDRDSQIGTGSTDLLLGAFYHRPITADAKWVIFGQALLDVPMFSQGGYVLGIEADQALGFYFDGWSIGRAKIRPIAEVVSSQRGHDFGPKASQPVASGYERVLLSPGIEIDLHPVMVDFSVEFPVYQYVSGEQLIAQSLFKMSLTYRF